MFMIFLICITKISYNYPPYVNKLNNKVCLVAFISCNFMRF
jgi:hypothetical protein